jgi:MoaA/NifB/PqqE/SkfB family radical SAM enzyme
MIALDAVKWLQVEATSKCNAWCPGCARNKNGYGLADDLVVEDLKTERFEEVLKLFPNLQTVDFCGTFGDAIAASNVIELTQLAMQHAPDVLVRTNGSLRSEDWWRDYAKLLGNHKHNVWFCLDGLEDTHHLYRQGTDYHKILRNAKAFIDAGGYATWQFIPWAHNEHQIKDCIRLSQELGFKKFELIRNVRAKFNAQNYRTGEPYKVVSWSKDKKVNRLAHEKTTIEPSGCMHMTLPSMYLNASGKLNVCCFFNKYHAHNDVTKLMDIPVLISNNSTAPQVCLYHCGKLDQ